MVEGHQDEEDPDTGGELVNNVRAGGEKFAQWISEGVEEQGDEDGEEESVYDGEFHVAANL